jgi:hypothetical protein
MECEGCIDLDHCDHNFLCCNKEVISEHENCCGSVSTGFTAIEMKHAYNTHCKGEYKKEIVIKESNEKSNEHEYFVSLVFKAKSENRNQIYDKISEMLEDYEDIKGFEYIAWRVDGVEE